jgi:proteasome accessory factor B
VDKMNRERTVRLWTILALLHEHRFGLRSVQIAEKLGVSRATADRYLGILRAAGFPVLREHNNGDVRHRFNGKPLPPLQPTPLQAAALLLARNVLQPLEGTRLVTEIDNLLREVRKASRASTSNPEATGSAGANDGTALSIAARPHGKASIVSTLDAAIAKQKRARLRYRRATDEGREHRHEIDPVFFYLAGDDLYLAAYVHETKQAQRFKVARMIGAEYLKNKPAAPHPEITEETLFGRSVKAWGGKTHNVVVRLSAAVAPRAGEYPLVRDQHVGQSPDGKAIVRARVAGLVEAKQWVLGWGAAAEALHPAQLRKMVQKELRAASTQYDRARAGGAQNGRARGTSPAPPEAAAVESRTTEGQPARTSEVRALRKGRRERSHKAAHGR